MSGIDPSPCSNYWAREQQFLFIAKIESKSQISIGNTSLTEDGFIFFELLNGYT